MTNDRVAGKAKEPEWLSRLATMSAGAEATRAKAKRASGSSGAASIGKSLTAWRCSCGWSGDAKELKPNPQTFLPGCPQCGKAL